MPSSSEISEIFNDKFHREISVVIDSDLIAFHLSKKVATLSIDHIDCEFGAEIVLYQIDIIADYRRAGIGLNLLRIASSYYGKLKVGNWSPFGDNPLLPDGRSLMLAGVEKGYVQPENTDEWPCDVR